MKRMRMKLQIDKCLYCLLLMLVLALSACREEEMELSSDSESVLPVRIIATHAAPVVESRLNYKDDSDANQPMQVTWSSNDKIKVFVELSPKAKVTTLDGQWHASYMAIAGGAGTQTAEFAGYFQGNIADGAKVWAFYPITAELSVYKPGMNIDLHRMITKYGNLNELMYYDYMVAEGVYHKYEDKVGGEVNLTFVHKVSMLRLELTLPETAEEMPINEIKIQSEDLLVKGQLIFDKTQLYAPTRGDDDRKKQYVEFDASGKPKTSRNGDTKVTAYFPIMPTTLEHDFIISAEVGGDVYSKTLNFETEPRLEAGKRYAIQTELNAAMVADYDWYYYPQADGSYLLENEADLRGFSNITNGLSLPDDINQDNFKGKTIRLKNSVELTVDWLPIGSSAQFAGTFDGQGHTISNLQIDQERQLKQAMFSTLSGGGCIKNLTVDGEVVCYDSGAGIVGLLMQGSVVNCTNNANVSIVSKAVDFDEITKEKFFPCVGGIVGYSMQGVIIGCSNSGSIKSVADGASGGIVGYIYAKNLNDASIGATDKGGYVLACSNHGKIIGGNKASGIVGFHRVREGCAGAAIGCYNSNMDITAPNKYAVNPHVTNNGCFTIAESLSDEYDDKSLVSLSTQEELNNTNYAIMNEAIVVHNKKFKMNTMYYCPYQWKTGTGGWPILFKMDGTGGSTGNYGDGGQLGN